jgi:PKD repeat protein
MTCKDRLRDLIFGTDGNSIGEITKTAKSFADEAVDHWSTVTRTFLKTYAQKGMDFIRPYAEWIPGQKHGDDVGGVLTDSELPAFREMMDEITTYFAEKGEYTRYIDPGELAIFFKEHPEFFKEGYTNALMKSTSHFNNATEIENVITPLRPAEAAVRRTEWHMFIDDLQQGLIDKFGDIRGKQLIDELGLKAARDAHEINAIIFKWGKRMWDNVYGAAKAAGATDEQAEALAKIAAESHINIGNGIASGAYKNQWQTKKGVIGWMQRHPLYTVVLGVGGLGYLTRMIPWYMMDNMPFNIWMAKEAGVVEKSFGDQEDEIMRMITTLGYQLRENPCNTTVQTNYVELLTLLKELKDIADTTDPVPLGVIPHFKSIYEVVYGVSIGVPNEYMRTRVKIDYSTAYTEYVLRVTEAGCTDPVEPPDGWDGVTGTGSIKCTADLICLLYLDDLYIEVVYPAGFVIAGVEPGSHTVKMTYAGKPDCVKTVTVVSGRQAVAECIFELPCPLPVPSITAPSTGVVKEAVSFKGSATTESRITWWHWDFGDGDDINVQNPSHVYWHKGTYLVQLTVTDDCGTATTIHTITIEEEAPPPEEESGTLLVRKPIDRVTHNECARAWEAEIYVDNQTIGKTTQFSIPFGTNEYVSGWGGPCGTHTIKIVLAGYQDTERVWTINDGDSKTWQPTMDPDGVVPPVDKFPINFYIPAGAFLQEPTKVTTVSRLVENLQRIRRR